MEKGNSHDGFPKQRQIARLSSNILSIAAKLNLAGRLLRRDQLSYRRRFSQSFQPNNNIRKETLLLACILITAHNYVHAQHFICLSNSRLALGIYEIHDIHTDLNVLLPTKQMSYFHLTMPSRFASAPHISFYDCIDMTSMFV